MSASSPTILKYLSDNSNSSDSYFVDQNTEMQPKAKKRRLDHLTWEEKIQRKKLKNRVAAQTSRDRKKQKMEEMQLSLKQMADKNEELAAECQRLRLANERLLSENIHISQRLEQATTPCPDCNRNRSGEHEAESGPTESLLRPQGTATCSAAISTEDDQQYRAVLLKMVLICFLYQTCSMNLKQTTLTSSRWSSLQRHSSKISPEIWRRLLKKQLNKNHHTLEKLQPKWWGRHQNSWNPVKKKKAKTNQL